MYFLRPGLSLNPELANIGQPTGASSLVSTSLLGFLTHTIFVLYVGAEDLNAAFHTCVTVTLSAVSPSLSPLKFHSFDQTRKN